LFLQHPNFIEDFQEMLCSSLGPPGSPSLSSTISAMTLLYCLFLVGKRARKYADARKIAGGIGLRLHDIKTLGWIVIEVCKVVLLEICDIRTAQVSRFQVVPDGAGDLNGVQTGDCITHIDGIPVSSLKSFSVILGPIGSSVALCIKRGIPGNADRVSQILEKGTVDALPEVKSAGTISGAAAESTDGSVEEMILVLQRKGMRPLNQANLEQRETDGVSAARNKEQTPTKLDIIMSHSCHGPCVVLKAVGSADSANTSWGGSGW
jgi:hypothetical protein